MTTVNEARQQLAQAEQHARDTEVALRQAEDDRVAARAASDAEAYTRHNQRAAALNIDLRFAQSAVEEARLRTHQAFNQDRKVRNSVANLSNEAARLAADLRLHQERVESLAPQLARVRAQRGAARAALALLESATQPAPEPAPAVAWVAPPAPVERDPEYPQPHKTVTFRGLSTRHYDRSGAEVDAWGRPIAGRDESPEAR